jgi:hypothetical protein
MEQVQVPAETAAPTRELIPLSAIAAVAAVQRPLVGEGLPWSDWPTPRPVAATLRDMQLELREGKIILETDEEEVTVTPEGLKCISYYAQYPTDFVLKLKPQTMVDVVNERIEQAQDRELTLMIEGDKLTQILPQTRNMLGYAETAQITYDALLQRFGSVEVRDAYARADKMGARFLIPGFEQPITPAVGDTVRAGIAVYSSYATSIYASLFTERLVCTNGMTTSHDDFKWRNRSAADPQAQMVWLQQAIHNALNSFQNMVERSRQMAETRFEGDYRAVLTQHARAMRLPTRYLAQLIAFFEQEPGDTEWHILNAFTRLATWGDLPENTALGIMRSSGDWAANFEIVTARLPRPIANQVGANIIEQELVVNA